MKCFTSLYIEERDTAKTKRHLEEFFSDVYTADNSAEAHKLYQAKQPDVIISTVATKDALAFLQTIREENFTIPIILTTDEMDKKTLLALIELGITKHIQKPIKAKELTPGIKKAIRYIEHFHPSQIRITPTLYYNLNTHQLFNEERSIALTSSQKKFLDLLIQHKDRVVHYREIENYIWHDKGMSEAAIRSLVHDMRNILGKKTIKNVSKVGYQLNGC